MIISLLTLTIAELNSTASLGPVLAIGIVVAFAAMMTLLPALLVISRPLAVLAGQARVRH